MTSKPCASKCFIYRHRKLLQTDGGIRVSLQYLEVFSKSGRMTGGLNRCREITGIIKRGVDEGASQSETVSNTCNCVRGDDGDGHRVPGRTS